MVDDPADVTPDMTGTNGEHYSPWRGLPAKLLLWTIVFIMLAEVLIFVPSIANFRNVWLKTRLDTAAAAIIVHNDSSDTFLSEEASKRLLEVTGAKQIAERRDGRSQLIAVSPMTSEISEHIALDKASSFSSIRSAFGMLFSNPDKLYRVFGTPSTKDGEIELIQNVEAIQRAMWIYARNILVLSLLIAIFAAGLVYLALYRLIVLPVIRLSANMDGFSREPDNPAQILVPSNRQDEIGFVEQRLSAFQSDLQQTLRQKQHLADLGLAVSKINHDLRNILASAQLFSDRISALPDPIVQRFGPKLLRTIDRAVDYTKAVMDYGRAIEAPPNRRRLFLHTLVGEVGELIGVDQDPGIQWVNRVGPDLQADGDPEQLLRVLMNLCRNSYQAMSDMEPDGRKLELLVDATRHDGEVAIRVHDTGPGIPDHLADKLFNAFQGSTKAGGTGLGMSIAHELVRAHGGTINIEKTGAEGTTFLIKVPDQTANPA